MLTWGAVYDSGDFIYSPIGDKAPQLLTSIFSVAVRWKCGCA